MLILLPVAPLPLAALPFLVEVGYVFVAGVWEAGLLAARDLVGYFGLVKKMKLMYFVLSANSSPAPVLLFRKRFKFVADVSKGIKSKGFTQARWNAFLGYWGAVCRHGPCGPITSLHPWDDWIPLDVHGFYKWVFDSLGLLSDFLRQIVVSRRDIGIRKWARWLREDLSSRPYVWLRPDFVPPFPFLVIHDSSTQFSHVVVELHLVDAEFRKAWMPFFL